MTSYVQLAAITFGGLYLFVTKDTNTLLLATGVATGSTMLVMSNNMIHDKMNSVFGDTPQFFLPPVATAGALLYSGLTPMQSIIGGGISFVAGASILWINVLMNHGFN